jgi:hypothetical protein
MDPKIFINIVLALLIGCLSAYVAKKRGRDTTLWFVLGVFFQFLALIVLLLLPSAAAQEEAAKKRNNQSNADNENIGIKKLNLNPKSIATIDVEPKVVEKEWFYLDAEHKQYGPYSLQALKELWKGGQKLASTSYVWQEGMDGWKRLSELPYLFQQLQDFR